MCAKGLSKETEKLLYSYVDELLSRNVPVIFYLVHLAWLMGLKASKLAAMIYKTERFYKCFRIPKASGEWREINAPTLPLKECQRWILKNILESIPISDSAHGFKKGKSILTNASVHVGNRLVLNVDVKDFFPSITWRKVFQLFRDLGYSRKVAFHLARIVTLHETLPQGAPTSPLISNVIVRKLDRRLSRLAEKLGYKYSRYADDISFSGETGLVSLLPLLRRLLKDEGFELNKEKVRVMRSQRRQEVTGLVVNSVPSLKKSHLRWLRQQIYYLRKFGLDNCLQRGFVRHRNMREYLYGHALFVKMISPSKATPLLAGLDSVSW